MRLINADALAAKYMSVPPDYYHTTQIVGAIAFAPTVKMQGWISVEDALPDESGYVLTLSNSGVISVHDYSAKWKSFNSSDMFTAESNKAYNVNNYIAYWLPLSVLPEPPEEVSGDE